jgi:hypothetical protein
MNRSPTQLESTLEREPAWLELDEGRLDFVQLTALGKEEMILHL